MVVFVVWGFLGSGKTTFINYLLHNILQEKKVAVIENESGKVSVDGILLGTNSADVIELTSGCVCCTLRGKIQQTIQKIQDEKKFDVVLIEPSGLASLEEMLRIPGVKIDGAISILDVSMFDLLMKLNPLYYRRQFSLSSVLLLTKTEKLDRKTLDKTIEKIMEINPCLHVVENYRKLDKQLWYNLYEESISNLTMTHSLGLQVKSPLIYNKTIEISSPIDWTFFREDFSKINRLFKNSIIRAKGILKSNNGKENVFNQVNDSISLDSIETNRQVDKSFITYWWQDEDPFDWLNCFLNSVEIDCSMENLVLSDIELYRYMGFKGSQPTKDIFDIIEHVKRECFRICKPRLGWRYMTARELDKKHVIVAGTTMSPDYTITRAFRKADFYVSLVASVGAEMNRLIESKRLGGDIMESFVADALGSLIAEAVVAYGRNKLLEILGRYDLNVSNSYSPGYCGWNVAEQKLFFSHLPKDFCGVTLTESSLMLPIKSVSTLLAVGRDIVEQPYGCDICHRKDCFKKKEVL